MTADLRPAFMQRVSESAYWSDDALARLQADVDIRTELIYVTGAGMPLLTERSHWTTPLEIIDWSLSPPHWHAPAEALFLDSSAGLEQYTWHIEVAARAGDQDAMRTLARVLLLLWGVGDAGAASFTNTYLDAKFG